MRLQISRSKNSASFYVIKTFYVGKKEHSKIIEKLGTEVELREKLNGEDPYEWANEYVKELNRKEKEDGEPDVIAKYSPTKQISKNNQVSFNGGYLFLQQIYHQLRLHKICKEITKKYRFEFNLDSVLSRLLYSRIIFPGSKLKAHEHSSQFIQQQGFDLQHVYRSLDVISSESDYIQSQLYKNSLSVFKRNTGVLYYDCTNFFFEIEQEEGLKQYGHGKDHKPNPIVQMGLFMDGDGIPLAFSINKGNANEQITLKPLEEQILSDFSLSKFVVCTDAGLASTANRKFNDKNERRFITTQSVKKLKAYLKEWALSPIGWLLAGSNSNKKYDITRLEKDANKKNIYYKERWVNEDGLEQRLIVTYSIKYKNYQETIRNRQLERAQKLIDTNPTKLKKANANDYKRFIAKTHCTKEGEVADNTLFRIDETVIEQEAMYDGFYAVCTNLEDDASEITNINKKRWEIEECFRIMKTDFKARPVYVRLDDRIEAHFATCFLALILFRFLEKKLEEKFTASEIISGLREMNFFELKGDGYIPTYTRTDFTDALHEKFGFRTDYEIVTTKLMKNIFKTTQN